MKEKTVFSTPWFKIVEKFCLDISDKPFYGLQTLDYVSVLAITDQEEILLVKQYRTIIDSFTLELPGGHVEKNQSPEKAAKNELFEENIIYKGNRLVNWDINLQTAISDLEVTNIEKNGYLYYIDYHIEDSSKVITVATTRPETLFGDSAICINPKDKRFNSLVGKYIQNFQIVFEMIVIG